MFYYLLYRCFLLSYTLSCFLFGVLFAKVLVWKVIRLSSSCSLLLTKLCSIGWITCMCCPFYFESQLLIPPEIDYLKILWKIVKDHKQTQLSREYKAVEKTLLFLVFIHLLTNAFNKYLLNSFKQSTMWARDVLGNMRNVVPPLQMSPAIPRNMGTE